MEVPRGEDHAPDHIASQGTGLSARLDVVVLGVDQRGVFLPLGCFTHHDADILV